MKTHLFCNAHIDPVWLWQWEEGLTETLSTFRAAADFLDEYPDLVFNHNESLLYEWIEEHDPALFARIQEQVARGRWEIVGGWFLQPDCNIPSGESIYRQVLRGRLYFYDKFGKVPLTAVNMDPFGHAQGLVQMFAQCGFKNYVITRPGKNNFDFDSEDFVWRGYEGSEVKVHRADKYNSVRGQAAQELSGWIGEQEGLDNGMYLWGVGNHGGGASRKDLGDIAELKKSGVDVVHSTPDAYFATVDASKLPVVERGLNPFAEGCYTSIIRIKQLHRRLENDLVMVEKMASHAAIAGLSIYEKELLNDAWRDLLFSEFHDSLPGSCIAPVEEDTIRVLHHGLEITARLKAKYLIALSAGQEKIKDPYTVPLMVYNPHPFAYKGPVDAQFVLPWQNRLPHFSNPVVYQGEERVRCQSVKEESNFYRDWCKRVVFEADLPPASLSRFDVRFEVMERTADTLPKHPLPTLAAGDANRITIETERGLVVINAGNGLVERYVVDGKDYLRPDALAVEVFNDSFNSWGGRGVDRDTPVGRFTPMTAGQATDFAGVKGGVVEAVRVVEEGEIQVVVEADMKYNDSKMAMRYIVDKKFGTLQLDARIFFAEKEKRVKLSVPTTVQGAQYIGQTIFGRERLDVRPGEYVSQYWQAVAGEEDAVTIIDDGVYGSSYADGHARITMMRSAGYGASTSRWGEPFHEGMFQPRMEQGERRFRFLLMGGRREERLYQVDREAAAFNQPIYALPFCPSGEGVKPDSLVSIDKDNVALSCFKQSERDPNAYILRVFEGQGVATQAHIQVPVLGLSLDVALGAFEIKTFRVEKGGVVETDMLEGALGNR